MDPPENSPENPPENSPENSPENPPEGLAALNAHAGADDARFREPSSPLSEEAAAAVWLTTSEADPWLQMAEASEGSLPALVARLRRDLNSRQVSAIVQQADLRRRAAEKFSRAGQMLFVKLLLEQATDEPLARLKARRWEGSPLAADICCGCGGDLIGLAAASEHCWAVDCDPVAIALARHNLLAYGAAPQMLCDRAESCGWPREAWVHIDPDRRVAGRKSSQAAFSRPGLEVVERLIARAPGAAVKLAPAAELPASWPAEAELQWLGSRGECRQQVAWFGQLAAHPGRRSVAVIGRDGRTAELLGPPEGAASQVAGAHCGEAWDDSEAEDSPPQVGEYLFEPHSAVLAAKLQAAVAQQWGLQRVSPDGGYWRGPSAVTTPLTASFHVSDVLPFDRRRVRELLRQRRLGRLEVKRRGVPDDPDRIRRQLRVPGEEHATLVVTRCQSQVLAVLCRRVTPA